MEAATKQPPNRTPAPREDPRAAGRAGGRASGVARRRKAEQGPRHWLAAMSDGIQAHPEQVAPAVLKSRNAAAIASVLQLVRAHERAELRTLRTVEQRMSQADQILCDLIDETERERERVARLREQCADLEQLRAELTKAIEADAAAHDMELVEVGDSDAGVAPAAA